MKHEEHSSLKEIYGTFSHECAKYFNSAKGPLKYLRMGSWDAKKKGKQGWKWILFNFDVEINGKKVCECS